MTLTEHSFILSLNNRRKGVKYMLNCNETYSVAILQSFEKLWLDVTILLINKQPDESVIFNQSNGQRMMEG